MKEVMKKSIQNIIAVTALLFGFSVSLFAQTSTIEGYVKDGLNGIPISGITIYIINPDTTTTTNGSGFYSFPSIATGTTITVSVAVKVGGPAGSQRTFVVGPGINNVDFWLNAVSDVDGNSYSAVEIGSKIWMGENLKVTHFRDGTNITNVADSSGWANLSTPGYCWYDNNDSIYKDIYGALYNWYAVNTNKLCPSGWHVPSDAEWTALTDYLGGTGVAGGKLKEADTIYWNSPDTSATNESGFTAIPGGYRNNAGRFDLLGTQAYWWSNTAYNNPSFPSYALFRYLMNTDGDSHRMFAPDPTGFSVRCLRDYPKPTIVTNIADSGIGSLRYALEYADSTVGVKDTIRFNIPGSGPFTIRPLSPLPVITDTVVIDGFSQAGASASKSVLLIQLDGTNAGSSTNGLSINTNNCIVKGLVINRFAGAGIFIDISRSGNIIAGNYIGTDINGTTALGNTGPGIYIRRGAKENKLGGITSSERNIISGNGIGIFLEEGGGTTILGNFIGVDVSGKLPLGNKNYGVYISEAGANTIGGANPGEKNVISSNGGDGIFLIYDASSNIIKGNCIGVDVSGNLSMGNSGAGMNFFNSGNNTIGGIVEGEGNIVSGNAGPGITLSGSNNNKILGNYLGTDYSGTVPMGNLVGVSISGGARGNQIGDTIRGGGNLIAYSKNAGILVSDVSTFNNKIIANSVYSNGDLGIDLGGDGVTLNDTNDSDTGPNNLQNFPVLDSVKFDLGAKTVFIHGYLQSAANGAYTLQFFTNKVGDNTGYGEGQTYLGSANVTTLSNGKAIFGQTFAISSSWGDVISSTATDAGGNTSEFSEDVGGLQNQIIPANKWPFYFRTNVDGVLRITDGSDTAAVSSSFASWKNILTANIDFRNGGPTTTKYASASDGMNLITFTDDQFPFSPGVLAITAKTLRVVPGASDAQIIDADIVVNPLFSRSDIGVGYNNPDAGTYDVQSLITHEVGHVLGLLHSGVYNATMFYKLGPGTKVRSLEQDDKSWASYRYPAVSYNSTYGSISGNIIYGYDNQPVAGALVLAINTSTKDTVHAYSDAYGHYLVPGLPAGQYNIYIEPLDGSSKVYKLKPGNISSYIYCNTVYTDYPGEFYSDNEGFVEISDNPVNIVVSAGHETPNINLITNKDITDPKILSVYPPKDTTDIDVTRDIIITFSEPIDKTTLTDKTCYLESGGIKHGVNYTAIGNNTSMILVALDSALKYGTSYNIHVTVGVTDLRGNPLESAYQSTFTTKSPDLVPPTITGTYPIDGEDSVFVMEKVTVFFSEPMNRSSVENSFTLTWPDGVPAVIKKVDGSFTWDEDNKSLTFTPLISLKEATNYTITVSAASTDLSGNHLAANNSFKFATVPNAPPVIVYLGPANQEDSVSVNTTVVADFSEPIDPASITSSTFNLKLNGVLVSGTFEFLNENSRVIFRPDANLGFGKTYLVTLSTGIKDISNPSLNMKANKTGTFITASQQTVPHIWYLDPPAGTIGSVVVIAGTGFDPNPLNNTVKFNTTTAVVTGATLTSLTTKVPLGASSGTVTVAGKNGVQADNSMYFYVIPQSDNPCDVVVSNSPVGTKSTKDIAVDPNAAYAYITNPLSDEVTVIDLIKSTQVATILVGDTPTKIDINSSGSLAYVTNFNSNDVSVIDLATKKVIKTIKVGIHPYGIVSTPNGKGVYVANYFSENLSFIDADPYSGGFDHVVATVPLSTKNTNVTITPDAGMVLVTGDDGLKIVDSNPKDANYNCLVATVGAGTKTTNVACSPDAALAIVSTEEGNLLIINLHPDGGDYSDAVIAAVPTGTNISNVKVSGDNMFVYATATDKNELLVYKITQGGTGATNGSSISGITLVPHNTIPVDNAPEGLVIDSKAEKIFVIDGLTGSRQVKLISLCCGPVDPAKAIGDLIMSIQNMVNAGFIKVANGKEIIDKLNAALLDLQKGNKKNAANDLNTFTNKVQSQINGHKITAAQGQPLITSANVIITQLNGTKSALVEPSLADTAQINQDMIPVSKLGVIYPNPFSQSITINYQVAENKEVPTKVQILIYDINGKLVGSLVDEIMQSGCYTASWNGTYGDGTHAPYGTYFVLFRAGNVEDVSKIMLLKPR